jgi:hypothetical protein
LRIFDSIKGILQGPLGGGDGSVVLKTISEDLLRRHLHIETKQVGEKFDDKTAESIPLNAIAFTPSTDADGLALFSSPLSFNVAANAPIKTLVDAAGAAIRNAQVALGEDIPADATPVVFKLNDATGQAVEVTTSNPKDKAKEAAKRIFELIDKKSLIDPLSNDGIKNVP